MCKQYKALYLLLFCVLFSGTLLAQNSAKITGNLQSTGNFFLRDSLIGAFNTPQYDHQLFGADTWLNLNYSNWGFDIGVRFDMFNNSNILTPLGSYTDEGIGRWYVTKKVQKLEITGGFIYDQIGSGIIYRAYEERPLLIDQALKGIRLAYNLTDDWKAKVFTGRQKRQFDLQESVIKGASLDGYLTVGDSLKPVSLAPGIGVVNRTLSDGQAQELVGLLSTLPPSNAIGAKFNTFAFSAFNTLTYGPVSWYVEGAYKTAEAIFNPLPSVNRFVYEPGSIFYTSASYAKNKFALTVDAKRTENFVFRSNPFLRLEKLNDGLINFLPPVTRINTYRLLARYNAATQEIGELAYQIDARYRVSKKLSFNVNYSDIKDLDNLQLYREIFTEVTYKKKRKWQILGGVQLETYNQNRFESKPGVPNVETITPYFEYLYKFSRKKAIRIEGQYMRVGEDEKGIKHDYGDWAFVLAEFSMAPHWTFTLSDMYNAVPGKNAPIAENGERLSLNYPRVDVFYSHKNNRFSLSYVKQVEGVVCSGGICRLEPAFNGVRMTVNSNF